MQSCLMEASLLLTLNTVSLETKNCLRIRTRGVKPTWTVQGRSLYFPKSFFEDLKNDVFVHHVALILQVSTEQAALKTHGSMPAPEKAIWTSNSCGPGQLNVSLIVIT